VLFTYELKKFMTDTMTIQFQQGGSPSPFDRNLATDLAGTAFHWLAEKAEANLTDEGKVGNSQ
jgi:6-phosphofructokinase